MIDARLGRKLRGKSWRNGNVNAIKSGAYRNLALVDLRTTEGKELREIAATTVQDKGGLENLSSLQLNLIEAYSILVWRRRRLGAAILNYSVMKKEIPQSLEKDFLRYVETEIKLCDKIGLAREARQVPSLQEYLKQKQLEASRKEPEPPGQEEQTIEVNTSTTEEKSNE